MIDDLFVGYSTPPALSSTPAGDCSSDDIRAPPYSPISILCSPHDDSLDVHAPHDSQGSYSKSDWQGFIIIGDNIDKTVHARHQTLDMRNRSLHYFNSYAVVDRCDFSQCAENHIVPDLSSYDVSTFLPTSTDLNKLLQNFSVLVGRMLTKYVPGFAAFQNLSIEHIEHKYTDEMSKKSLVVSQYTRMLSGILNLNHRSLLV